MRIAVELIGRPGARALDGWKAFLIREGITIIEADGPSGNCPVAVFLDQPRYSELASNCVHIFDGATPPGSDQVWAVVESARAGKRVVRVRGASPLIAATDEAALFCLMPFSDEHYAESEAKYSGCIVRGNCIYLPLCLGEQLSLVGSGFYSYDRAQKTPNTTEADERIEILTAAIDRNGVCGLLKQVLRTAFAIAGVPLVRKWYYQSASPSILLSRIDVDVLNNSEIEAIAEASKAHGRKATFFINLSGEEETEQYGERQATDRVLREPQAIRSLLREGHEIASHGYWHTVFINESECRADIKRSIELFSELGVAVAGYGAPGGVWYPSLQKVISELNLSYSSELGYAFDGLPCWPHSGAGFRGPVQIPVSPLIQTLLVQNRPLEEVLNGWRYFISDCIENKEPASFIIHPDEIGRYGPELYDGILTEADRKGLPGLTFAEFAEWWRLRAAIEVEATWDGESVDAQSSAPIHLAINDEPIDTGSEYDHCRLRVGDFSYVHSGASRSLRG